MTWIVAAELVPDARRFGSTRTIAVAGIVAAAAMLAFQALLLGV